MKEDALSESNTTSIGLNWIYTINANATRENSRIRGASAGNPMQTLPGMVSKWGLGSSQTLPYFITSFIQSPVQGAIPIIVARQENMKDQPRQQI